MEPPTDAVTTPPAGELEAQLRAEAEAAHAQYPQYAGHWDGWRVAVITKRIRTKFGVAFERGDHVLVSPDTRQERVIPKRATDPQFETRTVATAYSWRNRIDTSVDARYVQELPR